MTAACFGVGFFLYLQTRALWIEGLGNEELRILCNRLALTIILVPLLLLSFIYKVPFMRYWNKAQWNEMIGIPFIWSGIQQSSVKLFLIIAILINFAAFLPFLWRSGWHHIQEVWLFAIVFSIANAVMEELIWRGVLLSRFSEQWGDKWAVVLTSLGFGLQHYSLGFSWGVCAAFSVGGLYFGGITVKSNSIAPAVIWHMLINAMMVFSGMIGPYR